MNYHDKLKKQLKRDQPNTKEEIESSVKEATDRHILGDDVFDACSPEQRAVLLKNYYQGAGDALDMTLFGVPKTLTNS